MSVHINFDNTNNAIQPTFVLSTKNGRKLGKIPCYNIVFKDDMYECAEISFNVNKVDCTLSNFWKQIVDFKLLWVQDWNEWFEIYVEINESNDSIKNVTAKSLGEAELSQINLYDIEINTENDILRDDYEPTVLFNEEKENASLLSRILEKAPHYKIKHVDNSISNIQRTFSFNDKSIYDAFQEIATEIDCLFMIDCYSDAEGKIVREISVYDLESYCLECGARGAFAIKCEKCGSMDITTGYGKDTTIFVSTENLADNITYSNDNGSIKNCFKLEAGDDLMTATLINCSPNGSGYIWHISDAAKEDMSTELVQKLDSYDSLYNYYQNDYQLQIPGNVLTNYNNLINKYSVYSDNYKPIPAYIIGYPQLMEAYYNTVDFYLYLNDLLMPSVSISDTNARLQVEKLNTENLSPVAVKDLRTCSAATAESAVLAMAKTIVDNRYQVKISDTIFDGNMWSGIFTITNYSNEEDTATSALVTCEINDDYENYVKQKIDKTLKKTVDSGDATDIVQLFGLSVDDFAQELKKYSLSCLNSFYSSCQSCLDILIEQGISNNETWADKTPNLYNELYIPYYIKLGAIEAEIKVRSEEITVITGFYNKDGQLSAEGIQTFLDSEKNKIQNALDFEKYCGEDLWLEFIAYRREDTYKNDNYISDGLNNAELFKNALDFIEVAQKDILKSATSQHKIAANLKNLLVIKEFEPIVDYFEVGNWIRVRIDNEVYKLRLISYKIDFENLDKIVVEFSDALKTSDSVDQKNLIKKASSMSTTYNSVKRQASQGAKSQSILSDWFENGLSATNTKIVGGANWQSQIWDKHGMLFREYNDVLDDYSPLQLKIINSTIAITSDNWETTKAAVGYFSYRDAKTNELKYAYGINGETIIGKLIIGENLGIYNKNGNLTFNENGFIVSNGISSIAINPNQESIFTLSNQSGNIISMDDEGNGIFNGKIIANSGAIGNLIVDEDKMYNGAITIYTGENSNGAYINLGSSLDYPRATCSVLGTGILWNDMQTSKNFGNMRVNNLYDSNNRIAGMCTVLSLGRVFYSDDSVDRTISLYGDTGEILCKSISQSINGEIEDITQLDETYDNILMELEPILFTNTDDSEIHTILKPSSMLETLEKYNISEHSLISYNAVQNYYSIKFSELHAIEIASIQKNRRLIETLIQELQQMKG